MVVKERGEEEAGMDAFSGGKCCGRLSGCVRMVLRVGS